MSQHDETTTRRSFLRHSAAMVAIAPVLTFGALSFAKPIPPVPIDPRLAARVLSGDADFLAELIQLVKRQKQHPIVADSFHAVWDPRTDLLWYVEKEHGRSSIEGGRIVLISDEVCDACLMLAEAQS